MNGQNEKNNVDISNRYYIAGGCGGGRTGAPGIRRVQACVKGKD